MFNRRLLIDSGEEQLPQTYSVLEIHVDTPGGVHIRSARVELTYNGESKLANTDNEGIAVFYGVPTGTEISYTITAAGYFATTGKLIISTNVEYETEYVVLSPILLPTNETVLWRGYTDGAFTITIPAGVNVLKITTEYIHINNFVDPRLPIYVGVTPGKTYNMGWAYVVEGVTPEPEYFEVWVQRRNSSSDYNTWVDSSAGDAPEGAVFASVDIIMSYSASINNITPSVTDY